MSLKIGIVGTGSVARRNYVPCLAGEPDVELAYFSRTRARAEETAAEHGGRVCASVEELVGWEPDAVMVLTRETDRLAAAEALLDFGPRRLFFEKPLAAEHGQAHVREEDFAAARAMMQRAAAAAQLARRSHSVALHCRSESCWHPVPRVQSASSSAMVQSRAPREAQ